MGLYLRKSITVGPFRFNLSKSGVGVSAGVRGFRVGMSPRGNYVQMGRGGLYYRATIPSGSPSSTSPPSLSNRRDPEIPPGTHDPLVDIESTEASQMVDSSSRELLEEISRKRGIVRLWPIAAIATGVLLILAFTSGWHPLLGIAVACVGAASTYAAYQSDSLRKTVVLFYDLEPTVESAYGALHAAASELSSCSSIWHIEASGRVHDRKYHAGASELVRRRKTAISKAEPPYLKTNIATVAIDVGRQTLHFFPDRVLVYDTNGVGAISYLDLNCTVSETRFVEDGAPPSDSEVVGRTWKYVNKSGGPDKRFKDNKEFPICLYEEILLSSTSGLNELIQVSRRGRGRGFHEALIELGSRIPRESMRSA